MRQIASDFERLNGRGFGVAQDGSLSLLLFLA